MNAKYPDRCASFLLAKIYKPTWTQNHPWAYGPRMVLCPALEQEFHGHLILEEFKSHLKIKTGHQNSDRKFLLRSFAYGRHSGILWPSNT